MSLHNAVRALLTADVIIEEDTYVVIAGPPSHTRTT